MARYATTQTGEGLHRPARIVPWPYDASLSCPQIAPGDVRAAAAHAQRMHDAAMRGQLDQFMNDNKGTQQ